jgi:hypothetical protein
MSFGKFGMRLIPPCNFEEKDMWNSNSKTTSVYIHPCQKQIKFDLHFFPAGYIKTQK